MITEYDAFGPWIYKIDEEHGIPRLFAPYVDGNDGALFRLKIPRNIERRKANPDMDLYDCLVSVYEDSIRILTRNDSRADLQSADIKDITAVTIYNRLLFSEFTIFLGDRKIGFDYNAVSDKLVREILRHFRRKTSFQNKDLTKEDEASPRNGNGFEGDVDFSEKFEKELEKEPFFFNLWRDMKNDGERFLAASFQETRKLQMPESGFRNKLVYLIRKPSLQGSLHTANRREMMITCAEESLGYLDVWMPLFAVTSVATGLPSIYPGVRQAEIKAGSCQIQFLYEEENRDLENYYQKMLTITHAS